MFSLAWPVKTWNWPSTLRTRGETENSELWAGSKTVSPPLMARTPFWSAQAICSAVGWQSPDQKSRSQGLSGGERCSVMNSTEPRISRLGSTATVSDS